MFEVLVEMPERAEVVDAGAQAQLLELRDDGLQQFGPLFQRSNGRTEWVNDVKKQTSSMVSRRWRSTSISSARR